MKFLGLRSPPYAPVKGTATLVAGAVTVSGSPAAAAIQAGTKIKVGTITPGGTTGSLRVSAKVVNTSFTVTSSSGTDTSTIWWELDNQV